MQGLAEGIVIAFYSFVTFMLSILFEAFSVRKVNGDDMKKEITKFKSMSLAGLRSVSINIMADALLAKALR